MRHRFVQSNHTPAFSDGNLFGQIVNAAPPREVQIAAELGF